MLFFYIRHGDPIYNPDSLTPLGERQAEAVMKRLCIGGLDKIYASSSTRAILTATPAAQVLKKEIEILDWCNESYAWQDFATPNADNFYTWCYNHPNMREVFASDEMFALGREWYNHKIFEGTRVKEGAMRVDKELDGFMLSLGFCHDRAKGRYIVKEKNNDRVALFAHEGFGTYFLSSLLDIPYPLYSNHFTMCHTGMTVIDFPTGDEVCYPKVFTLSNDSHIYAEGLPTRYNNGIRF